MTQPLKPLKDFDFNDAIVESVSHRVLARVIRVRPESSQLLVRLDWYQIERATWTPLTVLTLGQAAQVGRALVRLIDRMSDAAVRLGLEAEPELAAAIARSLHRPDG